MPEAQSQAVNEAIVNAADSADLILTDVDMVWHPLTCPVSVHILHILDLYIHRMESTCIYTQAGTWCMVTS